MSTRKRPGENGVGSTLSSKLKKKVDSQNKDLKSDQSVASTSLSDTQQLDFSFFDQQCDDLAKALLGKNLVRQSSEGHRICGSIVETEAYLGHPDKAAHSYKGKTNRNEPMFMEAGTAYVYHIHSYCCMNISSKGEGAAVLLRALEPVENEDRMLALRQRRTPGKSIKSKDLCNGPSKLCLSLDITKDQINKEDMTKSSKVWIENGKDIKTEDIVHCKRINIGYAEEWIEKPLRFYVRGNKCVSKLDKEAEKSMMN